jgi:hypothetical protein
MRYIFSEFVAKPCEAFEVGDHLADLCVLVETGTAFVESDHSKGVEEGVARRL